MVLHLLPQPRRRMPAPLRTVRLRVLDVEPAVRVGHLVFGHLRVSVPCLLLVVLSPVLVVLVGTPDGGGDDPRGGVGLFLPVRPVSVVTPILGVLLPPDLVQVGLRG